MVMVPLQYTLGATLLNSTLDQVADQETKNRVRNFVIRAAKNSVMLLSISLIKDVIFSTCDLGFSVATHVGKLFEATVFSQTAGYLFLGGGRVIMATRALRFV